MIQALHQTKFQAQMVMLKQSFSQGAIPFLHPSVPFLPLSPLFISIPLFHIVIQGTSQYIIVLKYLQTTTAAKSVSIRLLVDEEMGSLSFQLQWDSKPHYSV